MLDLLLYQLRVELENWGFDPCSIVVVEGADHAPQINVRLDLSACSFQLREVNFFSHLKRDNIVIDDLLSFFKVADPALKLIDLGIGIILLKAFSELLQLMYLSE